MKEEYRIIYNLRQSQETSESGHNLRIQMEKDYLQKLEGEAVRRANLKK